MDSRTWDGIPGTGTPRLRITGIDYMSVLKMIGHASLKRFHKYEVIGILRSIDLDCFWEYLADVEQFDGKTFLPDLHVLSFTRACAGRWIWI